MRGGEINVFEQGALIPVCTNPTSAGMGEADGEALADEEFVLFLWGREGG